MQALEGRPNEAISRPSPSSDRNLLPRSRQKDGALVTVRYHLARDGAELPTYVCQHDKVENAGPDCQTIPGAGIDSAIGPLLIDTLTPLTVEAALTVTA